MIACSQPTHADNAATHQLTLYERQQHVDKELPCPAPIAVWRGFACAECIDGARKQLKQSGGQTLLLIWGLK